VILVRRRRNGLEEIIIIKVVLICYYFIFITLYTNPTKVEFWGKEMWILTNSIENANLWDKNLQTTHFVEQTKYWADVLALLEGANSKFLLFKSK